MHTDVIHDVADFEELPTTCHTDKDLIGTPCNEVVAEDLDEAFGDVLIKLITLCLNWNVHSSIIGS